MKTGIYLYSSLRGSDSNRGNLVFIIDKREIATPFGLAMTGKMNIKILLILFFLYIFMSVCLSAAPAAGNKNYEIILKRNIFAPIPGEKKTAGKIIVPVVKPVPLDEILELKGTVVFKMSEKSISIIENFKTRKMDFYHEGDVVTDAKILNIREKEVLFDYFGQEIILSDKGSYPAPVPLDASIYKVNLEETIKELGENTKLLFSLKSKQELEKGKTVGFRLKGIPEKSIFEKLGILNDDIITKINSTTLDSPEKALKSYENIMKFGIRRAVIHIIRNNNPIVLVYTLN